MHADEYLTLDLPDIYGYITRNKKEELHNLNCQCVSIQQITICIENAFTSTRNFLSNCYHTYGRYADFLSRLNDDRNIRALFERTLSSLPPGESVEVH